jgi:hypothetical protein
MIISASRRTDIPAFYSEWFINRLKEGFCFVQNPYNPAQFSHICLKPADVDAVVFWTRNALPIIPYLPEMNRQGYRYYFLYTVMANPRFLDPCCPGPEEAVEGFKKLASALGPDRVVWRYDPIVLTLKTDSGFHIEVFDWLASRLRGFTNRVVISLVQVYRKNRRRLERLSDSGSPLIDISARRLDNFLESLASYAAGNGIEIFSCAQHNDMTHLGIKPGRCIDPDLIERALGIKVNSRKDPSQRPACGCVVSRDIGAYDTCIYGCRYCYASSSLKRAQRRFAAHDPLNPMLVPLP